MLLSCSFVLLHAHWGCRLRLNFWSPSFSAGGLNYRVGRLIKVGLVQQQICPVLYCDDSWRTYLVLAIVHCRRWDNNRKLLVWSHNVVDLELLACGSRASQWILLGYTRWANARANPVESATCTQPHAELCIFNQNVIETLVLTCRRPDLGALLLMREWARTLIPVDRAICPFREVNGVGLRSKISLLPLHQLSIDLELVPCLSWRVVASIATPRGWVWNTGLHNGLVCEELFFFLGLLRLHKAKIRWHTSLGQI
jgi:hypothetical protein